MAEITYLGGDNKKQAAALSAAQTRAVHCLLIPLSSDILLLPNAAVAEVTAYQKPRAVKGAPDWYLGQHTWRDYQIPVIVFEALNGDVRRAVAINKNSRIAVLNTLNGNARLPYVGLLSQGIPKLQVVQSTAMEAYPGMANRHKTYVTEFVMVNGEAVTIPNIDMLEQVILGLGF